MSPRNHGTCRRKWNAHEPTASRGTIYGYDDNGNRTSVESSWSQLGYDAKFDVSLTEADTVYDSADKLLQYGTKSYTWNNFGQLASMTDSDPNGDGNTSDSEATFYQYDLYGNLLRVDLPDGRAIEYEVDGAGRRVRRRELAADGTELSFRGWIYRDLLRPIAEVDRDGNVVARYVYRDGDGASQNAVSQLSTRVGARQDTNLPFAGRHVPEFIEMLDKVGSVERTLAMSTNQVGSVKLVTDAASGEVLQRIDYDEFGRTMLDTAPGLQPFGFAGGMRDSKTDLVRIGARDYSIALGRWTSRDPIRVVSGQRNFYCYTDSDPVNDFDPTGLLSLGQALEIAGGGLAAAGVACLALGSGPVGWTLIAVGVATGATGNIIDIDSMTDNMSQAEDMMDTVNDRNRRTNEQLEELEELDNQSSGEQ